VNACRFLLLDLLRDAEDIVTGGEVAGDTDDGVRCVEQDRDWAHGMILPPSPYLSAVVFRTSSRRPVMYTVAPFATSACVIWWNSQPRQQQHVWAWRTMRPMPVPPPVTTALKSLSWKSSEALNCELVDMMVDGVFWLPGHRQHRRVIYRTRLNHE
jgi:hypothetical protein